MANLYGSPGTLGSSFPGRPPGWFISLYADIVSRALAAAGAESVALEEIRTLDEDGNGASYLRGRDFDVWACSQRPVCAYLREFRLAVRVGGKASGKLAQDPSVALANTQPGIRLSSPRVAAPFSATYQQVGLPGLASSDAQLGRSVYAYQSGEVACGTCGADGHGLWRIAGQHSRAYGLSGGKTLTTLRAEVVFRPCCSSVTHVAIPGSYSI